MLTVLNADLHNPTHASAIVELLNHYASDPMGGNEPLSAFCQDNLIHELQKRPTIYAILAYLDHVPAGLSICIEGFSTFACMPLLNIHDIAVHADFRGQGIARAILAHVEELAYQLGCCKITLEVLEGNHIAQALYTDVGFAQYELDPATGGAIMMQKKL